LSIQRATAAGAFGSEDYPKAGNSGRANNNLCKDFKKKRCLPRALASLSLTLPRCHWELELGTHQS
jgi:hypothetical protein